MNLPLKYRVLEVLITAFEREGATPLQDAESVIGAAFHEVDGATLRSILAELKADGLINYMATYDGGVEGLVVAARARSSLVAVREESQRKDDEKRDARRWQVKSMVIGYSLGFVSGVGVMIVRELSIK